MPDADDVPVIGRMARSDAAQRLREMGDSEASSALAAAVEGSTADQAFRLLGRREIPAYMHTSHAFGFIGSGQEAENLVIRNAGDLRADVSLRGARLNLTLLELRVADYPGSGSHDVLLDFAAQHRLADGSVEQLHFNQVCRGQEGGRVGVMGYPIFIGISAGSEGLAFECRTINVKNANDESFIELLDGDVFKAGLRLAETAQPAIAPLAGMVVALTKSVAKRHQNVPVQHFLLGLDFSEVTGAARLAEGTYIAVQIPESDRLVWEWSEWVYSRSAGRIVSRHDPEQLVPYNYISFGLSRHHG